MWEYQPIEAVLKAVGVSVWATSCLTLSTGPHLSTTYQDKQANHGMGLHHCAIRTSSFFLPAIIHTMQRKCVCVHACVLFFFVRQCDFWLVFFQRLVQTHSQPMSAEQFTLLFLSA